MLAALGNEIDWTNRSYRWKPLAFVAFVVSVFFGRLQALQASHSLGFRRLVHRTPMVPGFAGF